MHGQLSTHFEDILDFHSSANWSVALESASEEGQLYISYGQRNKKILLAFSSLGWWFVTVLRPVTLFNSRTRAASA